jgi:hypothetical protein
MTMLSRLRSFIDLKEEGLFNFVFMDETWIFQDGTISKSWQDNNVKSVRKTKVEKKRFVI